MFLLEVSEILTEQQIDRVLDIMMLSFPQIEVRTREAQKELFDLHEYQVEIIEQEDKIVGFVAFWELEGCTFLEHLAIDPAYRGQSLGSRLMERVLENAIRPILVEIEPVTDEGSAKRLEFYKKFGFKLCGFDYLQPPLQEGMPFKPLLLMTAPDQMTEDEFAPYKEEIYLNVYNVEY